MSWLIDFSPSAQRDLNQVPPRVGPSLLEFIYAGIAENPQSRGNALRGPLLGVRSARRGDYAVLSRIDETTRTVQVLRVAGRGIAYQAL